MQSVRNALNSLENGQNASLLLARYLKATKVDDSDKELAQQMRDGLFSAAIGAVEGSEANALYKMAFEARKKELDKVSAAQAFETTSRLIAGLGASNVLETGLTLNPIYGVPMIPGSSLKGIAAHYCSKVWGAANVDFRSPLIDEKSKSSRKAGEIYEAIFGKVDDNPDNAEAGYIRFYDAWMLPESMRGSLVKDVMTPHHGDYYGDGTTPPSDFDDPNPVTYLSVRGKFEVRVGCLDSDESVRKSWEKLVLKLLKDALKFNGAGGKTSSGYGRMLEYETYEERKEKATEAEAEEKYRRLLSLGFDKREGERVVAICSSVNKKGNCQFIIDGNSARFNPVLKDTNGDIKKGTQIEAEVESIDETQRTPEYVLRRV